MLTANQVKAALDLADSPLIYSVDVDKCEYPAIIITSVAGAEWNGVDGVDMLIAHSLDKEFPDLEYCGRPLSYHGNELYTLESQGETLIFLVMKKASSAKEANRDIQQSNCSTEGGI